MSTDYHGNQDESQKQRDQLIETQEGVTAKHVNQTMETASVGEIKINQKGIPGPKYETSPSGKEESSDLVQANSPQINDVSTKQIESKILESGQVYHCLQGPKEGHIWRS